MTEEINFNILCNLSTRVLGLPEGSLSFKNRSRKFQSARASVCYIALKEENIDRNIIADVLNRDRTITYHYERTHKKKLNKCKIYRDSFTKIYKEYKNLDGKKDIFVGKRHLRNYLLQNKVVESKNSDMLIEVKSGDAICIIKTTFLDFSNQLKNISLALVDYHYSIKII